MTLVLVFVPIGALLALAGLLFEGGRIAPTVWFGGRAPRSQRARRAGLLANRFAGRTLLIGGGVVIVAALAAWVAGASIDDEFVALSLVAAVAATCVTALVRALRAVRTT
jgi:uncharacterized membrane protein